MTRDEIFRHFQLHEGAIGHMYLDTAGKVTIGIGFMIPDPHSALAYPLIERSSGTAATGAQKVADWTRVSRQPVGRLAQAYKRFTRLALPEPDIERLLDEKLAAFAASLETRFARYPAFPPQARLALLDMIFNLGPSGLFNGFPNLCRAVARLDWTACAAECRRRGISPRRNEDCRNLFAAAAISAAPPYAVRRALSHLPEAFLGSNRYRRSMECPAS